MDGGVRAYIDHCRASAAYDGRVGTWVRHFGLLVLFVLIVWISLLWLGRKAVLSGNDLRDRVGSWAGRRGWTVRAGGPHLLMSFARAEQVIISARGPLAGRECTVMYCQAVEWAYVACVLRLPEPRGTLVVRRRWRWAARIARGYAHGSTRDDFDLALSVRTATGAGRTLLTTPVRSALAGLAMATPFTALRLANDLVIVEVGTWVAADHQLDAIVAAMAAIAEAATAANAA